jgi:hypothetical protein
MRLLGRPTRLLTCDCCKEALPTGSFSWNGNQASYSHFCKSCNNWLSLFYEQQRHDDLARVKAKKRGIHAPKYNPRHALWGAWMGQTKEANAISYS